MKNIAIRIVSGGQSGVDRAALDAALASGIDCGGWCPAGRRAEDGPIDDRYPLREMTTGGYAERTRRNVEDSDATLILVPGNGADALTGGTALTLREAARLKRPTRVIGLGAGVESAALITQVQFWLQSENIQTLNVAGPRESSNPGLYETAREFLIRLIKFLNP